jgi:hypothetical protein
MIRRKKNFTIILILALSLVLAFSSLTLIAFTDDAYAASGKTKKMTVYNNILKRGNTVFVNLGKTIASVNTKTGKVKILTGKSKNALYNVRRMALKNNYIYFVRVEDPAFYVFLRVNIKTGKKKRIAVGEGSFSYVISGNKIYYRTKVLDWSHLGETKETIKKVMQLSGKSKKKTVISARNTVKKSNAPGYKIVKSFSHKKSVDDGDGYIETTKYYDYYLQMPNGKRIFIITKGIITD